MPDHRLAEVFGYPVNNESPEAQHYRHEYLWPFNSSDPLHKCTKYLVQRPGGVYEERKNSNGVCSIQESALPSITCPVRFREGWTILRDAAAYFFPEGAEWRVLPETSLRNASGEVVGNIDFVLVRIDAAGQVTDFGAVEVQGVYISGNVGNTFRSFLQDPSDKREAAGPFHADYLSSVKRLLQQLVRKGVLLSAWGKKQAIMVDSGFLRSLPQAIIEVPEQESDMAWFAYDLVPDPTSGRYALRLGRTVYTTHQHFLKQFSVAEAGPVESFVAMLTAKLRLIQQAGDMLGVAGASGEIDDG